MRHNHAAPFGFHVALLAIIALSAGAATAQTTTTPQQSVEFGVEVHVHPPQPAAPAEPTFEDRIRNLGALEVITRVNAARALGESGNPAAIPHLINSLRTDPSPEVRGWVVRALHHLNTPEAIGAITTAARHDADERVRSLAIQLVPTAAAPTVVQTPTYASPQAPIAIERTLPPRPRREPGRGLRIAGWIIGGSSYGFSLMMGITAMSIGDPELFWPMFLPLVGPAIQGFIAINDYEEELVGLGIAGVLMSCVQIAGFTMAMVGTARRARARRAADQRTFAVLPSISQNAASLSVVGVF